MKLKVYLLITFLLSKLGAFAQLNTGVYMIGPGGNFESFSAAIYNLRNGVQGNGDVIFNVQPGIYPEQITIPHITGTNQFRRVIFRKSLNIPGSVVIKKAGGSGLTDATVTIKGASYIVFDSINIEDGGTNLFNQMEVGYKITQSGKEDPDGTEFNTIKNCYVRMGSGSYVSPFSIGIWMNQDHQGTGWFAQHLTIDNVEIDHVARGIVMDGHILLSSMHNIIRNCKIGTNGGLYHNGLGGNVCGIYAEDQGRLLIENNTIKNLKIHQGNFASVDGIYLDASTFIRCEGNNISSIENAVTSAAPGDSSLATAIRIKGEYKHQTILVNNFISNIKTSSNQQSYAYGIKIGLSIENDSLKIFQNSISITHPITTQGACIEIDASEKQISAVIRNNILIGKSGVFPLSVTKISGIESDYNILNRKDVNQHVVKYLNIPMTLSSWKALSLQDENSKNTNVQFVDELNGDLHLAGSSILNQNLKAPVLSQALIDIDGDSREGNFTYTGADEAYPPFLEIPANYLTTLKSYPTISQDILTIEVTSVKQTEGKLSIVDISGVPLYKSIVKLSKGINKMHIPVMKLYPGQYLIEISTTYQKLGSKFIKQ